NTPPAPASRRCAPDPANIQFVGGFMLRKRALLGLLVISAFAVTAIGSGVSGGAATRVTATGATKTPIKHLVVIFQENVSFDHYFGTYPVAANTDGSPFIAAPGTPAVNGLL